MMNKYKVEVTRMAYEFIEGPDDTSDERKVSRSGLGA